MEVRCKHCLPLSLGGIALFLTYIFRYEMEFSEVPSIQAHKQETIVKYYDCLATLNGIIDRDEENNFIIPPDEVLKSFSNYVLDCLHYRYTKTIQKYCSQRSRHGSMRNGWNICVDSCYKPTKDDIFHVLSVHLDSINKNSVENIHHSKVKQYDTRFFTNKEQISSFFKKHDIRRSMTRKDVLFVDVGQSTKNVLDQILQTGILDDIQQLSIRTFYGDENLMTIDYIPALNHLRQLYNHGFRIYWSRQEIPCVLKNNPNRTSCIYLDMVRKECKEPMDTMHPQHLVIPDDKKLISMNKGEREDLYHKYLTSTQVLCKEVIRLGGIKDGGWDFCNDAKYIPKQPCLVYSFGIFWDFKFDDAIAEEYGCEVHSFDPSMNSTDFKHSEKVWFHNVGLTNKIFYDEKRKWNMSNLKNIRETLGHSLRNISVLKMDIEWSEWEAIPDMVESGALRDVTQFYIEFHSYGTLSHLQILRLLYNEGFRIFWYHRNENCSFKRPLVEYSICNEVYFLRP